MQLLSELEFKGEKSQVTTLKVPTEAARFQTLLLFGAGQINAQGKDGGRLLLRVNGLHNGYQSLAAAMGHHSAGEWDGSGAYLGRTGWALDSDFSFEATIAFVQGAQRVTFVGSSTFGYSNNNLIGWEAHSFVGLQQAVTSVEVLLTDGLLRGGVKIYTV